MDIEHLWTPRHPMEQTMGGMVGSNKRNTGLVTSVSYRVTVFKLTKNIGGGTELIPL